MTGEASNAIEARGVIALLPFFRPILAVESFSSGTTHLQETQLPQQKLPVDVFYSNFQSIALLH